MDSNVFISWSKPRGRQLADALHEFIPDVIQAARPWMSSEDIGKGRRWGTEISKALEQLKIGIICLTPESLESPWVLFEAGALAKLGTSFVCPYLLDLEPQQVRPPLADFQMTRANHDDTLRLLETLNEALGSPVESDRLVRVFDLSWPSLNKTIQELARQAPQQSEPRPQEDILEEILARIREMSHAGRTVPTGRDGHTFGESTSHDAPSARGRRYPHQELATEIQMLQAKLADIRERGDSDEAAMLEAQLSRRLATRKILSKTWELDK